MGGGTGTGEEEHLEGVDVEVVEAQQRDGVLMQGGGEEEASRRTRGEGSRAEVGGGGQES